MNVFFVVRDSSVIWRVCRGTIEILSTFPAFFFLGWFLGMANKSRDGKIRSGSLATNLGSLEQLQKTYSQPHRQRL